MVSGEKKDLQSRSSQSLPPDPKVPVTATRTTMMPANPATILKFGKDTFNYPSRVVLQMFFIQVEQRHSSIVLFPSCAAPGDERGLPRDFGCCYLHEENVAPHEIPAAEEKGPDCGILVR